jgi:hypothetical protein
MLHMVVNVHNPESCAFRSERDEELLSGAFDRLEEVGPEFGIEVKGSWVNPPSHEIFILVDAANTHAIDQALIKTGLIGRTHSRVLSVIPTKDLEIEHVEQAAANA